MHAYRDIRKCKPIFMTAILLTIVWGTYSLSQEITITTIMPGTDTARVKRGVIGENYEEMETSEIGDNNMLIEGNLSVGSNDITKGKLYVDPLPDGPGMLGGDEHDDDFIIDNNGNVGIGTDTPAQKVDINGVMKADVTLLNPVDPNSTEMLALEKSDGMLIRDATDNNRIKEWNSSAGESGGWVNFAQKSYGYVMLKEHDNSSDGRLTLNFKEDSYYGRNLTNGKVAMGLFTLSNLKDDYPQISSEPRKILALDVSYTIEVRPTSYINYRYFVEMMTNANDSSEWFKRTYHRTDVWPLDWHPRGRTYGRIVIPDGADDDDEFEFEAHLYRQGRGGFTMDSSDTRVILRVLGYYVEN